MLLEFKPINRWSDLPIGAPRDAPESWALDFKADHSPGAAEHAKDMAAFANVFGGTILVGVAEKADSYERKLLSIAEATSAARDYEDAARDLLLPAPMVDAVIIPLPADATRALVAINVDPFAGQMVGARIPGGQAWRFPIRRAARHTAYLDPLHMMIHSDPKTRRAAILLGGIPDADRRHMQVQIMERYELDVFSNQEELLDGELAQVDVNTNAVSMRVFLRDRTQGATIAVPLEDVEAVWKTIGGWSIRLDGALVIRRDKEGHQLVQYMSSRGPFSRR